MQFFDKGSLSYKNNGRYQLWWALFWIGFFLLTYLSRAIFDPDFFWHLKTGEWIWQHRMLPDYDPFTLAPVSDLTIKQQFTLTSYWLSQLIYYGLVQMSGWWGIVLLRVALTSVLGFFIYRRCEDKCWSPKLLLVIAGFILLATYPLERPQVFSFVGFAALLYLLHKFRAADRELGLFASLFSLSALMILWGNLHGGVLLGQLTLIAYLCFLIVDRYLLKPALLQHRFIVEMVACVAGILCSLVNPNGLRFLDIFVGLIRKNEILAFNVEYSTFFSVFLGSTNLAPTAIFIFLLVVFVLRGIKRRDFFPVLICLITGLMSLYQTRYIPFFLIAALPLVATAAESFSRKVIVRWSLVLVVAFQFIALAPFEFNNIAELRHFGFVRNTPYTPVSAVDYIVREKLEGNILNAYDWGGYMIYRLDPEHKVYVDGRVLYEDRFWEWIAVSGGAGVTDYSREKIFDNLVDKYEFKYVLVPKFNENGITIMANDMVKRKDWEVIYYDIFSMILARQVATIEQ